MIRNDKILLCCHLCVLYFITQFFSRDLRLGCWDGKRLLGTPAVSAVASELRCGTVVAACPTCLLSVTFFCQGRCCCSRGTNLKWLH